MGIQWVGGEENGYPMFYGSDMLTSHGSAIQIVVEAAWNLPPRCWSGYDVKRLEEAVKEIRKRYDAEANRITLSAEESPHVEGSRQSPQG